MCFSLSDRFGFLRVKLVWWKRWCDEKAIGIGTRELQGMETMGESGRVQEKIKRGE